MVKTRKSIAVHVKENKARASRAGAMLSAMRKTHRGGRPRMEGVERCPCGVMTLKRARARCHIDAGGRCIPIPGMSSKAISMLNLMHEQKLAERKLEQDHLEELRFAANNPKMSAPFSGDEEALQAVIEDLHKRHVKSYSIDDKARVAKWLYDAGMNYTRIGEIIGLKWASVRQLTQGIAQ